MDSSFQAIVDITSTVDLDNLYQIKKDVQAQIQERANIITFLRIGSMLKVNISFRKGNTLNVDLLDDQNIPFELNKVVDKYINLGNASKIEDGISQLLLATNQTSLARLVEISELIETEIAARTNAVEFV